MVWGGVYHFKLTKVVFKDEMVVLEGKKINI